MTAMLVRQLSRPEPALPPAAMRTWAVHAPPATHWQVVSCQQYGCLTQQRGFRTILDTATDLGRAQAGYLRTRAGRPHREHRSGPSQVTFVFPPGTDCFTTHRQPLGRPALYVVRDGDWRAYGPATRLRPDQWVDTMADHLDQLRRKV